MHSFTVSWATVACEALYLTTLQHLHEHLLVIIIAACLLLAISFSLSKKKVYFSNKLRIIILNTIPYYSQITTKQIYTNCKKKKKNLWLPYHVNVYAMKKLSCWIRPSLEKIVLFCFEQNKAIRKGKVWSRLLSLLKLS